MEKNQSLGRIPLTKLHVQHRVEKTSQLENGSKSSVVSASSLEQARCTQLSWYWWPMQLQGFELRVFASHDSQVRRAIHVLLSALAERSSVSASSIFVSCRFFGLPQNSNSKLSARRPHTNLHQTKEQQQPETITEQTRTRTVLRYIKNISENKIRLLKPRKIEVANKPIRNPQKILSKIT